jgi:hypothetical protein
VSSQTIGGQRGPAAAAPASTQANASAHKGTQADAGTRVPAQARAPQAEMTVAEAAETEAAPAAAGRPASVRVTAEAAGAPAFARVAALAAAEPAEPEQTPAPRRVAGVCAWAAVLGLANLVLVICGLVTILGGSAPDWYQPVLIGLGLGGVALAVTAFLTIQLRVVPWIFMALSSVVVLASLIVTGTAA